METVVAGQAIKNNLYHPEAGIIKATIDRSKQISLSDSYSFEKQESSSHEIGFSLGLSNTINWGPADVALGSTTFEASFESTWSSSNTETWSRSNEKSITEE